MHSTPNSFVSHILEVYPFVFISLRSDQGVSEGKSPFVFWMLRETGGGGYPTSRVANSTSMFHEVDLTCFSAVEDFRQLVWANAVDHKFGIASSHGAEEELGAAIAVGVNRVNKFEAGH